LNNFKGAVKDKSKGISWRIWHSSIAHRANGLQYHLPELPRRNGFRIPQGRRGRFRIRTEPSPNPDKPEPKRSRAKAQSSQRKTMKKLLLLFAQDLVVNCLTGDY